LFPVRQQVAGPDRLAAIASNRATFGLVLSIEGHQWQEGMDIGHAGAVIDALESPGT